eukprot:Clim_evm34s148 gene=Clim_evmTU34s148
MGLFKKGDGQKVFMDIDVGDGYVEAERERQYERAKAYLEKIRDQLGFPAKKEAPEPKDLDEEQQDLLVQQYLSVPSNVEAGKIQCWKPKGLRAGRLVIELFTDVPKATENFSALITGEKGISKDSGKPMHYKGIRFHRRLTGKLIQAGDFVFQDGRGGESIYGKKFKDEKPGLKRKFDCAGRVAYANSGKDSNTSQFFITFIPTPNLDGKHVIFGQVVEGLDVLEKLNQTSAEDEIVIADCGLL